MVQLMLLLPYHLLLL